jgi:cell division protein FtsN
MPKIEPGVYEPSDDVRVFDDADEVDEEGSRLPLLIVIALLVLAAFAGVVYLAYTQGVQRGRADAPRAVASDTGQPGNSTPYKGLKIYEQPAPANDDGADEDTAPPPPSETVKPPPAVAAQAAPTRMTPPPATATNPTAAAPSETATKPPQPLVVAAPKPKPAQAPPAASAPVIPPGNGPVATALAEASDSYVLQIVAYKSQDEASASWKSYQAKHPMLGGYESDVKKVDLGDKGTWYRLRVEGFASKDAASALCSKLKADGGDCLLAKQ